MSEEHFSHIITDRLDTFPSGARMLHAIPMILGRATYDCTMQCTTTNLNESNGKTPQKVHLTVIPGSEGVLEDNSTGGEKHTLHEHTDSGSVCTFPFRSSACSLASLLTRKWQTSQWYMRSASAQRVSTNGTVR